MLVIDRDELARNLLAYGEREASERVPHMSQDDYKRVCEIGFRHALTGMILLKAGCLAVVEVVEGMPRPLKRKRRVMADAPAPACISDPAFARIAERFEAYSGGVPVRKKEILDGLSLALAPDLPGFRYHKATSLFRKPSADGMSFVLLEGRRWRVCLHFGVSHTRVEATRAALFDDTWKPAPWYSAAIRKYSGNMGPNSPHWRHPTETDWPIGGSAGLERAAPEIATFIREVVLPYITVHQTPEAIRDTLLNQPGRADVFDEGRTVFAIDHLLRRRDWLEEDYGSLREQHLVRVAAQAAKAQATPAEQENAPYPAVMTAFHAIRAPVPDPLDVLAENYRRTVARWDGLPQA